MLSMSGGLTIDEPSIFDFRSEEFIADVRS
jgi:hypothetical protein